MSRSLNVGLDWRGRSVRYDCESIFPIPELRVVDALSSLLAMIPLEIPTGQKDSCVQKELVNLFDTDSK